MPEVYRTENDITKLKYAMDLRYKKQRVELPSDVHSAIILLDLLDAGHPLVKQIYSNGSDVTASPEKVKSFISKLPDEDIDEQQTAFALLFMTLTPDWREFDPEVFISALRSYLGSTEFDWQRVVKGLDYKSVETSKEKFLVLYNALLPIAKEDSRFDIQALWGGQWSDVDTQLSYLRAFLSCSPSELDATTIPGLRQAYEPSELLNGPNDKYQSEAETALRDPTISLDAVTALVNILVPANGLSPASVAYLTELLDEKAGLFLCSVAGVEKPWTKGQEDLIKLLFQKVLDTRGSGSAYVFYSLWKQDKSLVAHSLFAAHLNRPLDLLMLLDIAQDMDWMADLLTLTNGFGLDLAALVHRKGALDLEQWLNDKISSGSVNVIPGISRFLELKADDELRTSREEQAQPGTVSLAMNTVHDFLAIIDTHSTDRADVKARQRQCLQAYPRLIIYCEGFTENVDVDFTESNSLPPAADAEMQDLYKRMYSGELSVENILEHLQKCKESGDPARLDLFACMIHGLYDEFSCFGEYPLGPLAITAVLFGGILRVRLISDLTLRVGQDMVLDSVRDFLPEDKMYKFGLQALIHIIDRFQEPEWAEYCSKLVRIPGLRDTQAYSAAAEALSQNNGLTEGTNGTNGVGEEVDLESGDVDDMLSPDNRMRFKSVNAEPAPTEEEPGEEVEEKVVFFFNNVTEQNLKSRIGQIEGAMHEKYQRWFARSLVEGRAKVEPNNQGLYLQILDLLSNKTLWNEVLRETFVSVQKLLNAESTLQSASERKYLKNLSVWLGSLTLARDKPIKQSSIAFLDLLVEGFNMQKLLLVIPFTCNVLAQGARSQLFKPPNPWVVGIIAGLMELYHEANIKLNQKFEIEVLFREFGLNEDSIPPSMNYRGRRPQEEEVGAVSIPDGLDSFDELSLGGINKNTRNPRFDVDAMTSTMPDLNSLLVFPPASGSAANQVRLRQIVQEAVRRAIVEIVAPVVERSVTIATIATTALVHKDFGTEADEDRVREAAQNMVRQLSGSLALVTCKEPLKMSMTNYIRMAQADLPEQAFAEGSILMCVNDNLDIACKIVEEQAEERSMPEIEAHIESELTIRRQWLAEHPNEPFVSDSYNRWSNFIPDPYKQTPGGLNQEQMAIYLDFARQSRGPTNHTQTASVDSGRQQLPDVLQDTFSTISSVPTPADQIAMPHQPAQQQQHHQSGRMLPPPLPNSIRQVQTNGYLDIGRMEETVQDLMNEIRRIFQLAAENESSVGPQGGHQIAEFLSEIMQIVESTPDSVGMNCAENICKLLYGEPMAPQEAGCFIELLAQLYDNYPTIRIEVTEWARGQDDEKFLMMDVTIPLIKSKIVDIRVVDAAIARLVHQQGEAVVESVMQLFQATLFTRRPVALRTDFAATMEALGQLSMEMCDSESLQDLMRVLKEWGIEDYTNTPDEASRVQELMLRHVFEEWIRLCELSPGNPSAKSFSAFISQMISRRIITSQQDTAVFFRLCIDEVVGYHDMLDLASKEIPGKAYFQVDWLARLVVVLVKSQGELNGAARGTKASYMDSLLSLITLVMNNHAVERGERFNQRIFFRLWSSILNDWNEHGRESPAQDREMVLVFAENFVALNPSYFPAFTFGWLTLIGHRVFMPALLKLPNDEVGVADYPDIELADSSKGCILYSKLISMALSHISVFVRPGSQPGLAADLYRAILRTILILHHDFPEFLAENHFRLCNASPPHCTQFYNLVLSAYPTSIPELPNPFVTGLKTDRLEEMKKSPRLADDYLTALQPDNLREVIDDALRSSSVPNDAISRLADAVVVPNSNGISADISLIHAIVLYIGQSATSSGVKSLPFSATSAPALLLSKLSKELSSDARYHFVSAVVNQLRYPNTHTHYFSYALLHLFSTADLTNEAESDVRLQITRVLLERMYVVKPQPWGLVVTTLELLKNPDYNFWVQSFIKDLPAVGALFGRPLMKNYGD